MERSSSAVALQGLVDGGSTAEVGEVVGRPDLIRFGRDPGEQPGTEVGVLRQNRHVRNMIHFSDTGKDRPKIATFFGQEAAKRCHGNSSDPRHWQIIGRF
jgi:hypothetical protein